MKKIYALLGVFVIAATFLCAAGDDPFVDFPEDPFDDVEYAASINDCVAGGYGARSCSIDVDVEVAGFGIGGRCSISCDPGLFACCGYRCRCVGPKELVERPTDPTPAL